MSECPISVHGPKPLMPGNIWQSRVLTAFPRSTPGFYGSSRRTIDQVQVTDMLTYPQMSTHKPSVYSRTSPDHSPAQIASSPKVRDVKISPDGKYVLYQVTPFYKASDRTVSELWLAEVEVAHSAKKITSGLYNDKASVFHPDGKQVVFLSDRHSPGKASHIYILDLNRAEGTEPVNITQTIGKKGVQDFVMSPDGRLIAFTSADEPSEEQLKRIHEKDDAKVFGEKNGLSRLRVYNFATGEILSLENIRRDRHIESFTWSPDSKELLYRLRRNRGSEYAEREVMLERVAVEGDRHPRGLGAYPRSPSGQNIWLSSGHITSLQSYEAHNALDARTLCAHCLDTSSPVSPSLGACERLYGATEDAVRSVDMRSSTDDLKGQGMVAVEVCSDVDTHIDVVSFSAGGGAKMLFKLFRTYEDAIWFGAWDARRVIGDHGGISYVFAAVLSSGTRHEPPNVWAGRVVGEQGGTMTSKIQLSSHLQWLREAPTLRTEVIHWEAVDGTELSGLVRYPPGYDESWEPLPTVLFIHGGPYRYWRLVEYRMDRR